MRGTCVVATAPGCCAHATHLPESTRPYPAAGCSCRRELRGCPCTSLPRSTRAPWSTHTHTHTRAHTHIRFFQHTHTRAHTHTHIHKHAPRCAEAVSGEAGHGGGGDGGGREGSKRSPGDRLDRAALTAAHPLERALWLNASGLSGGEQAEQAVLAAAAEAGFAPQGGGSGGGGGGVGGLVHPLALYGVSTGDAEPKSVVLVHRVRGWGAGGWGAVGQWLIIRVENA